MQTNVIPRAPIARVESGLLYTRIMANITGMRSRSLSSQPGPAPTAGFSLIEVTMAIGIIAFAFIAIMGLVPMGMTAFRASSDRSVGTWITQQVVNEVQQTDFNTLVSGSSYTLQNVRFYDVDGRQLTVSQGAATPQGAIYQVHVRVTQAVNLPGVTGSSNANPNLATVTVQIANNPGNQTLTADGTTKLWPTTQGVSMMTYSAVVSGYLASNSGN